METTKASTEQVLPTPGEIIHFDYRDDSQTVSNKKDICMVQWNIERGYKLSAIIQILKDLNADIIALQEIDIGCERSDHRDTGVEIAKALKMNCMFICYLNYKTDIFLCEFEELHHPIREKHVQGGGVHGNGILTR